jgi:hypothetical protein
VPPPPAAAAAASTSSGRSAPSVTNIIAIALTAGLVVLAVLAYSCVLLWRRVKEGGDDDERAAPKLPAGAVPARVPSDVGSSSRNHRSPPPSSTASDAIYLDPLTSAMEVRQHRLSPDLRPLQLTKQASPDLRPLPPLKRAGAQPPPPPAATPPMTGTEYSSDEDDQATFYTARKTAMSSFSRSTSQRSTLVEEAVPPPVPVSVAPPPPVPVPAAPPPNANHQRPPRPPAPPPLPRQRLLRPMPSESPPPAALANLSLTSAPDASVQDRGGENSDVLGGSTRPPSLKPLHWDKLRAISGRTTVWDQVKNSDSFR